MDTKVLKKIKLKRTKIPGIISKKSIPAEILDREKKSQQEVIPEGLDDLLKSIVDDVQIKPKVNKYNKVIEPQKNEVGEEEQSIQSKKFDIEKLLASSKKVKKTTISLRKLFEKEIPKTKAQDYILQKNKKKIDDAEKGSDKKIKKKKVAKVKLPNIKKFVGNFFRPGSSDDPVRAISALAAFKTATKLADGNFGGAIIPALIFAGLNAGPALISGAVGLAGAAGVAGLGLVGAVGSIFNKKNPKAANQPTAKKRYFNKHEFETKADNKVKPTESKVPKAGKAFARFGKAIIPGVGAALGAIDATLRAKEGDVTGSKIAGVSASLDTLAAASAATGVGLPVAGLLSIASFGLDVVNLVRDISGASEKESRQNAKPVRPIQKPKPKPVPKKDKEKPKSNLKQEDRLRQLTKKQKELVVQPKGLTFAKTLDSYEKVVNKFQEIMELLLFGESSNYKTLDTVYPESKDDSEDSGDAEVYVSEGGADPSGYITSNFGWRGSRMHQGVDFAHPNANEPVTIIQPGVVDIGFDAGGWGNWVAIKHNDGAETLYGHFSKVNVKKGQKIEAGTVIGNQGSTGRSTGPHIHFEYRPSGPGSPRVDGAKAASKYFRYGGKVSVKSRNEQKPTDSNKKIERLSTDYPNQSSQLMTQSTSTKPQITSQAKPQSTASSATSKPQSVARVAPKPTPQSSDLGLQASLPMNIPEIQPVKRRETINIEQSLPYQEGYKQDIIAYYPATQPTPQKAPVIVNSSQPMSSSGPSESQVLNSLYRTTLLNSLT